MSDPKWTVLWVDDDDEGRFVKELIVLRRRGWRVVFVRDIKSAVERLSNEVFEAVILDQGLPFVWEPAYARTDRESVWGGCVLLHWIRGKKLPAQTKAAADHDELRKVKPKERNRSVSVLIVSGFHDTEIEEVTRSISPLDREIKIEPKPLDTRELIRFAEGIEEAS